MVKPMDSIHIWLPNVKDKDRGMILIIHLREEI